MDNSVGSSQGWLTGGPARHRERHVGGEGLAGHARQGGGVGLWWCSSRDGADVAGAWRGNQRRRADRHGLRWSWGARVAEVAGVAVARLRLGCVGLRRAATVLAPATSGNGSGVAGVGWAVLSADRGLQRRGSVGLRADARAGRRLASGGAATASGGGAAMLRGSGETGGRASVTVLGCWSRWASAPSVVGARSGAAGFVGAPASDLRELQRAGEEWIWGR
ncbi:uncharacterized PE-PGRS family protein PE_PGRS54-like [Eucalyptus grandis]|uniref:uncharacterized PE-PGRS family protein PE_PGRS54-like n=1 Tax=Eucalyptus grandis TaxID=71139 RepID=UPI00192E941D|nr:uncharacterized PE-PGRS family protein PE_PGRS54-like [Eucalyptus grandis]